MTLKSRRVGFTLIELLVVIAIIGILAAMLFPVFARARESARKIQCLSNVKNIAMAFQMYLTDYDAFPPTNEGDQAAAAWWTGVAGMDIDCGLTNINPYLRYPVLLDEYIKNRDVWRCPSAKGQAIRGGINSCVPDYLTYTARAWEEDSGLATFWFCSAEPYPSGWGGSVTDSWAQGLRMDEGDGKAFTQDYGVPTTVRNLKGSAVRDPARQVVLGDVGGFGSREHIYRCSNYAYPGICVLDCDLCTYPDAPSTDWEDCGTSDCGAGLFEFALDAHFRQNHPLSRPPHLGGSNLGFADGHAKWMGSEAILFGGEPGANVLMNNPGFTLPKEPALLGVEVCGKWTTGW